MKLSKEAQDTIKQLKEHYPKRRGALLPSLWIAQHEHGWLSTEIMKEVTELLEIPTAYAMSLLEFHPMLNKNEVGEHVIKICTNISCMLRGSDELVETAEKELGITLGQTSSDMKFTLKEVECQGYCGTAPVCDIDDVHHENMTPVKLKKMLDEMKR